MALLKVLRKVLLKVLLLSMHGLAPTSDPAITRAFAVTAPAELFDAGFASPHSNNTRIASHKREAPH